MPAPPETLAAKALQLLLKEYENNQLILHQMVIEVPHLTLTQGIASFDRLLIAGVRIDFLQFSQLTNQDVDRVCFFLGGIISRMKNLLINKPPPLSRKEFLDDLNKVTVSYVRSQRWSSPS